MLTFIIIAVMAMATFNLIYDISHNNKQCLPALIIGTILLALFGGAADVTGATKEVSGKLRK